MLPPLIDAVVSTCMLPPLLGDLRLELERCMQVLATEPLLGDLRLELERFARLSGSRGRHRSRLGFHGRRRRCPRGPRGLSLLSHLHLPAQLRCLVELTTALCMQVLTTALNRCLVELTRRCRLSPLCMQVLITALCRLSPLCRLLDRRLLG